MEKGQQMLDEFTEEETARRRDAVIKRMMKTPPKPRRARSAMDDTDGGLWISQITGGCVDRRERSEDQ